MDREGLLNQNIETHGVTERTVVNSIFEEKMEEIKRNGWAVVEDVIPVESLDECRRRIDDAYAAQVKEFGGEERLGQAKDKNVVRMILAYDDYFLQYVNNKVVMEYIRAMLGENVTLSSQVGVLNRPAQTSVISHVWHRDLQYQHFVSSKSLAAQALFCIEEFTVESGGTLVLPGSHKFAEFPSERYILKHQVQLSAPAGSVIIFDSMLYHRTGQNVGKAVRRGINNVYVVPVIQQQISYPAMLKGKFSEDPELRRLLGYEWGPPNSLLEWREERLRRNTNQ
jgi:ectoine hydroxylase-related dioxygenase (phytanoyl-CoA dioxygenase family)